jgi:K(+)-stimulated pyrophosphate-energized sodium pump
MNMVCLLGLGTILLFNVPGIRPDSQALDAAGWSKNLPTNWVVGLIVSIIILALIFWAVWQSKRETKEMKKIEGELILHRK